jgi:hypothetical protein
MLAMVRRWLWAEQHFQLSSTEADLMKVPRSFFEADRRLALLE